MKRDELKGILKEALTEFFSSDEGRKVFGQIVFDAINEAMLAEINFEDGKSESGRIVEKTETVNMIQFLARYIPGLEGSLRGVQSDAAQARNRAAEARNGVGQLISVAQELARVQIESRDKTTAQIGG